jgi:hypothetical protein
MAADNFQSQINQIQVELAQAEEARASGNEGMARVCSRRAAGIAIGIYLSRQGFTGFGPSIYERLIIIKKLPNISPKVIDTAQHLILKVNEDHQLPIDIDLIEATHWLIHYLLPDMEILFPNPNS